MLTNGRALMEVFIQEGDTILDPFMGSGTTLSVTNRMQRHSIGIEIVEQYYNMINAQLRPIELYLFEPPLAYESTQHNRYIQVR
jgi:site-specific DNA-methyltransferase (adenine-specific)